MTDHRVLMQRAGKHDGHEDVVLFLFAGITDNESLLRVADGIDAGDTAICAELPDPEQRRPYPPTDLWLAERVNGDDSPYSAYLDLCDAYCDAYREAVRSHIRKVAAAIKEGRL